MDELSRIKENLYKEGSPIVVQTGVLCAEEESRFASITFRSLSDKPITSVLIDLHIFDRANIEVEVIRDYLYLAGEVQRDQLFGADSRVEVTNPAAMSMAVAVRRVAFGEDDFWDGSNSLWYECIPSRRTVEEELEEGETVEQFRRDFAETLAKKPETEARFVPIEYKDLWLCSCGEINRRDEEDCKLCGAAFLPQRTHIDNRVQIDLNLAAYKKMLIDKAEQARLEAERIAAEAAAAKAEAERLEAEEKARQERKAKQAKRAKITALAISIPLAVAAIIYIIVLNTYIIPQQKYSGAKVLLDGGKLDEAITAFSAMDGYADSAQMVIEAKYRQAEAYLEEGNYAEALTRYEAIAADRDVAGRISEVKYRQADDALAEQKYEDALKLFSEISGYQDADAKADLCSFSLAKQLAGEKNFEGAKPYFDGLADAESAEVQQLFLENGKELYEAGSRDEAVKWFEPISDPAALEAVNAVYYAGAMQDIEAKQFDAAREILTSLGAYSDSPEQLLRIVYLLAEEKFTAGAYEEAIPLYEEAGAYSDAADKVRECRYRMARAVYDAGSYTEAIEQFDALGDYSDAASMALEARYQLGVSQLNSGAVTDAYNTLYAIKGYGPAYALLVSNSQFYIHIYDVGAGSNPLDE